MQHVVKRDYSTLLSASTMEIFFIRVLNMSVAISEKANVNSMQPNATYQLKNAEISTLNDDDSSTSHSISA